MSKRALLTLLMTFAAFVTSASANVVTDWDETAVKIVQPAGQVLVGAHWEAEANDSRNPRFGTGFRAGTGRHHRARNCMARIR